MFTRHIQPSFAGGEVSPALAARGGLSLKKRAYPERVSPLFPTNLVSCLRSRK